MGTYEVLAQIFRPRVLISVKEAAEVVGVHYKTMFRPGYDVPRREIGGCRVEHLGDLAKWIDGLKVVEDRIDCVNDGPSGSLGDAEIGQESRSIRRKRGRPRKSEVRGQ
jgi:hypothetical protein